MVCEQRQRYERQRRREDQLASVGHDQKCTERRVIRWRARKPCRRSVVPGDGVLATTAWAVSARTAPRGMSDGSRERIVQVFANPDVGAAAFVGLEALLTNPSHGVAELIDRPACRHFGSNSKM